MRHGLVFLSALIAWIAGASAQEEDTLRALLIEYRCPIVDRLDVIYHAGNKARHEDRFIVVARADHAQSYVQCLFFEGGRRLLCEASSGFYYDKPGAPRSLVHEKDAVAALGRLGFDTDGSSGNYRLERDVTDPPDFNAIADLILKALYDGYGARAYAPLRIKAPFAPGPSSRCIPLS